MKKVITIQLLLIFININAQIDSVQEALRFYPLHIGDIWQYNVTKTIPGSTVHDISWIGYKEVVGDTLMNNSKKYFVIKEDKMTFPDQSITKTRYIRIDSSTAEVFELYHDTEYKIDSLLIKKNDKFLGYECKADTIKEYFGIETEAKLIAQYLISIAAYDGWELAKDFGEVMRYFDDVTVFWIHYQNDLIYAKIDGTEYGVKTSINYHEEIPNQFELYQNYPNPFNPSTVIRYSVPRQVGQAAVDAPSSVAGLQQVSLKVFDVLGNEITTLVNDYKSAGKYETTFNGAGLASGIYIYRLSVGEISLTRKMVLLR